MSNRPEMDRRAFLYGASLAGFGIFCQGRSGRAAGVGPNDVIQVAGIGVGGKGSSDIDHAGNHGKVVAICDAVGAKRRSRKRIHRSTGRRHQPIRSHDWKAMPWTHRVFCRTAQLSRAGKHARVAISRPSAFLQRTNRDRPPSSPIPRPSS